MDDLTNLERQLTSDRFQSISDIGSIHQLSDSAYLADKFRFHEDATTINEVPLASAHIVTGFGPTSAPTCGTLSVILKAHALSRGTGIETTIIISNLGAWCSRTVAPEVIARNTSRFVEFIEKLGLINDGTHLRTHEDLDALRIAGLLTRFLSETDLMDHSEVTADLYDRLGLLGNRFGVWTDTAYTVADILEPLLLKKKRRVLVLSGLEESYFTHLAKLAITRMDSEFPGLFLEVGGKVGALYTKLIGGLHPYPKMSKSIPASSIGLDDSENDLREKIVRGALEDDGVRYQMISLASDWSPEDVAAARTAFEQRFEDRRQWHEWLERYFEYFREIAGVWKTTGGSTRTMGSLFRSQAP